MEQTEQTTNQENNLPIAMVEVPALKVMELLKINEELRRENAQLKVDLATVFVTSLFFTTLMDSPMTAIMEFLRVIKKPKKYAQIFSPMTEVIKKYPELVKQIKEEMGKRGIKTT